MGSSQLEVFTHSASWHPSFNSPFIHTPQVFCFELLQRAPEVDASDGCDTDRVASNLFGFGAIQPFL